MQSHSFQLLKDSKSWQLRLKSRGTPPKPRSFTCELHVSTEQLGSHPRHVTFKGWLGRGKESHFIKAPSQYIIPRLVIHILGSYSHHIVRRYLDPPLTEHLIAHTHAKPFTPEMYKVIPVTVRIPSNAAPGTKFPTILTIYGLDGHRLEHTMPSSHHIANGWASIAVEIPGTGDCPADPNDPTSPERLWSSVLGWMHEQSWIDQDRIAAWGVSCGAYYAMRIAHTHKDHFAGVVAQGGGCHHMFDPEWLEITRFMEYPFE